LLVVGGPPIRKILEFGTLDIDALGIARIPAPDNLVDEAAIGGEIIEVGRPPHQQRVLDRALEMTVRSFDGAVLMGEPTIVARWRHPIMGTQVLIAGGQILLGLPVEIVEGGREAVGSMFPRRAAERPQGVLHPLRQGDEALAAEHDMGVLEAGIGEPEVIEPVIERRPRHRDADVAHVGEVRQSGPAGLVDLPKDDFLLFPIDGAPGADPPLQGPPDPRPEFGMASEHLLENGDGSKAGSGLQHRHDLRLEEIAQRVRPPPSPPLLLLRR
jgi:hypothetical protein